MEPESAFKLLNHVLVGRDKGKGGRKKIVFFFFNLNYSCMETMNLGTIS